MGDRALRVSTAADGGAPVDTLCYATPTTARARIRHEQLLFVEHQKGEDRALLNDGVLFVAAPARAENLAWAYSQRFEGRVVRLWRFNEPLAHSPDDAPANFPATDDPHAPWYREYCEQIGAVK